MLHPYSQKVVTAFKRAANPANAAFQKAYMRDQFDFFGLKTPERKKIQAVLLKKDSLPSKVETERIVKELWAMPQREVQYFTQEFLEKYTRQLTKDDITLLEFMVTNRSWWDTVDMVASHLIGAYFQKFPDQIEPIINQWLCSGNLWLQRSCLLFQLKYKADLDTSLLTRIIKSLTPSKEFFINKAIGWILREYSKVNPEWVADFINTHPLDNLSKKEGLKIISQGNEE